MKGAGCMAAERSPENVGEKEEVVMDPDLALDAGSKGSVHGDREGLWVNL